jgi:tetratricopeptide (TPR) repeat protein
MKINLPDYALPTCRNVFANCPASSKNIYINGVKIFQEKIEKSNNPGEKSAYYDTLMQVYDQRIKFFGEDGYVLGRKGKDMLKYNNQDFADAYETLNKSMQISGIETDPGVAVGIVETGCQLYKTGQITAKALLSNYLTVCGIVEMQLNDGGKPDVADQMFTRINAALGKAGLNNCIEIEDAFKEKVSSGTADQKILFVISDLMLKSNCDNSVFYGEVNEKLFGLAPDSDRAYVLAWFYIKKEKYPQAVTYLNKAIEIEADSVKQAHYYNQLALIYSSKMDQQKDAVENAKKAINLLPSWGEPYFVLASAYILGSKDCFQDAFEKSAVYWVATDLCYKAKSIDKEVEEKAIGYISDYSRFFPNNEDVFFRSMQEGSEYVVGCWINEKTTVRVRK